MRRSQILLTDVISAQCSECQLGGIFKRTRTHGRSNRDPHETRATTLSPVPTGSGTTDATGRNGRAASSVANSSGCICSSDGHSTDQGACREIEIDEEAYQQAVDVLRVSGAGVEPEPALSEQERTEYKTGP